MHKAFDSSSRVVFPDRSPEVVEYRESSRAQYQNNLISPCPFKALQSPPHHEVHEVHQVCWTLLNIRVCYKRAIT